MATILSPAQIATALRKAGFPESELPRMTAVALAESGGKPRAHNPNAQTGDNSYGLWQINMLGGMGPERRKQFGLSSNEDLFDPVTNARAAKGIFDSQGPNAWSVVRTGAYKQHLARAEQAVRSGGQALPAGSAPAPVQVQTPPKTDDFTQTLLKGLLGGVATPSARSSQAVFDPTAALGLGGGVLLPVAARGERGTPRVIGGGGVFDYLSQALEGGGTREMMSSGAPLAGGGVFAGLMKAILNPSNQGSRMGLPSASQALPSVEGLATGGGRMKVGKVAHPSQDVFPTTGAHLDVRVMKDGEYINPESARSILRHLKVGGQPLYSQQGAEWKPSYQVTSGFGPRIAPTAGASSYHRGVDYAVSHGVPLEWEGGGSFKRGHGYGQIDIPGYTIKLLHTVPD